MFLDDWSADGRYVLYRSPVNELWAWALGSDAAPQRVLKLENGYIDQSVLSQDSQWIAYNSTESGRAEVYVKRFPPTSSGDRWKISADGGMQPVWNRNGRELFFLAADGTLMSVELTLTPGSPPIIGTPRALFRSSVQAADGVETYVVASNGDRFLMALPVAADSTVVAQVIVNWPALLTGDAPAQ